MEDEANGRNECERDVGEMEERCDVRLEGSGEEMEQRGELGVNESNPSSVQEERICSDTKWHNRIRLES